MRLHRTLTPIVFILCLLVWPALVQADFQTGMDAYDQGDYATALKEWRPLAEQGDMLAQFNLGSLYERGQGVPQDHMQAGDWWRKAADQGYPFAQAQLGVLYHLGQGVPKDDARAADWYRKAANQGNAKAKALLGRLYQFGWGVPQDEVQAHMWFNLAAAQGVEEARDWREKIANKITPAQLIEAQRLAREWMAQHQK